MIILFLYFLLLSNTHCTIDLNLSEFQYLADHLHQEECRKLVASLHFKSFEKPNALDEAEHKVSKDVPCLRLLLHWNSEYGEGLGETHEVVGHRLRQIGRHDLADWLGKTVFHELGQEMKRSLDNPFQEILNTTIEPTDTFKPTLQPQTDSWDPTSWIAFDTICWTFVIGLVLMTILVLGKMMCMLRKKKKTKTKKFANEKYDELYNEESNSESEDRFDIRTHDSALQLLDISSPS